MSLPPQFTEPPPGFPKSSELYLNKISNFTSPPPPPGTFTVPTSYPPISPVHSSITHSSYTSSQPPFAPYTYPQNVTDSDQSQVSISSGSIHSSFIDVQYLQPPASGIPTSYPSPVTSPYSHPPPPKPSFAHPPPRINNIMHERPNFYQINNPYPSPYVPGHQIHHPPPFTSHPPPLYPPRITIRNKYIPKPPSISKYHPRFPISFRSTRKPDEYSAERNQLLEKWRKNYCETSEEIAKKLSELANEEKECWVRSSPADVYYKRENANVVVATPRLEALCKVFDEELLQRAAKVRENQPSYTLPTPKRKHRVCKHKCKINLRIVAHASCFKKNI